ncbi:MAG TPA: zf-HC2 domain-containing protein [Pyrinomonadaceae bacterium]|jgi:anti-sigma factor RsiW
MDCKEFRERLDRYVDGELSGGEAAEAREHLKGCASCRKAEAGLRHLRSALKRVVERRRPPRELEGEVLRALRSREREPAGRAPAESRRVVTPVWRAKVSVPVPFLALLVLSLVALAGWLVSSRAPARGEVTAKRPSPVASPAPPVEASGGFDFSRYYRGERASIQVVRRASPEGSRQ